LQCVCTVTGRPTVSSNHWAPRSPSARVLVQERQRLREHRVRTVVEPRQRSVDPTGQVDRRRPGGAHRRGRLPGGCRVGGVLSRGERGSQCSGRAEGRRAPDSQPLDRVDEGVDRVDLEQH
jgi:hypothetical protein